MRRNTRWLMLLALGLLPLSSPGQLGRRAQAVPSVTSPSRLTPAQRDGVLREHNSARSAVGVAPLFWSDEISAYAQAWADDLAANSCEIHHRVDLGRRDGLVYGENLAGQAVSGGEMNLDLTQGVRDWVAEKKDYPGGPLGANWHAAGHYTQVVWRDTLRVGCGVSQCRKGEWQWRLLVCNYNPPGNVMGRRPF